MNIVWTGSPNYSSRNGKKIIAIVNHITSGFMPGCLSWLRNPQAKASAHYLVTREGNIYQLVRDEYAAWHAGAVNKPSWSLYDGTNPNRYTLGIEHEGTDGSLTEAQYQTTLWLHRQLTAKYNIPIDDNHIIGHYRIDSVNRAGCPGPKFPWEKLFEELILMALITQDSAGNLVKEGTPAAWATQAVATALSQGFITQTHNANELVTMGAMLAILQNILEKKGLV